MTSINVVIMHLSAISRPLSDPAVRINPPLSPSSLSSSYIVEIMVLLPSGVGGGDEQRPFFSGTGEDQVHLIINLHTPSDLCSTHPPGSNMCISLWEDSIGPLFHPRPAPAGSCGDPELIYGPNGLVPSDSDALLNAMRD